MCCSKNVRRATCPRTCSSSIRGSSIIWSRSGSSGTSCRHSFRVTRCRNGIWGPSSSSSPKRPRLSRCLVKILRRKTNLAQMSRKQPHSANFHLIPLLDPVPSKEIRTTGIVRYRSNQLPRTVHIVHEHNRISDWLFDQEQRKEELLAAAVEDLGGGFGQAISI